MKWRGKYSAFLAIVRLKLCSISNYHDVDIGKEVPDFYVYIMTNQLHTTLYTGMTNNLFRRVSQHRSGKGGKFTARYHLTKLVYYEILITSMMLLRERSRSKADQDRERLIW